MLQKCVCVCDAHTPELQVTFTATTDKATPGGGQGQLDEVCCCRWIGAVAVGWFWLCAGGGGCR
jgi:hypothetical protein